MDDLDKIISRMIELSDNETQTDNFNVKEFQKFATDFYTKNSGIDFLNYFTDEFYGIAKLSFDFLTEKKPGEFKIRISNPKKEAEGFDSFRTFIDIVNDDRPFLIDSIVAFLDKLDVNIINVVHPIYSVIRDKNGKLLSISDAEGSRKESVIQFHMDRVLSPVAIEYLITEISKILETVNLVVDDWSDMIDMVKKSQSQIENAKVLKKSAAEISEIKDFIS